jgi:subtilisin family serine protease
MIESGDWREFVIPKVFDETDYIIRSFREAPDGGKEIRVVSAGGGIGFMYAEGEILVREDHLDRVLEILEPEDQREQVRNDPNRVQPVIEGVVLYALRETLALDALDTIDQQLGRGIATPNHVLTVAGGVGSNCPATEPQEVYYDIEPYPSVCPGHDGAGVLIYLADTGLLRDAGTHSWLDGVQMGNPIEDVDPKQPLQGDPPDIPPYTSHGTFVAGVMRCMAPAADIIVTNAFSIAGSQLEADLVPRLEAALGLEVDIFHLTIACLSRYDLPLIAFQAWLGHLHQHKDAVCVVAAGNSGFDRKTWPAAFPGVIAVGALGGDWRGRATFSNFGPWVDVYSPGRDLINAYATGTYTCHVYPYAGEVRNFYGMAKWSGTSFSTPIVSGRIAARMSRTGENARQAAAAVLAEARAHAIPGVGPVLLPCCHDHDECAKSAECGCRGHQHRPHIC